MPNSILILHATDATETAKQLQKMFSDERIFSLTYHEILLQGHLIIPELVAASAGVVIVLSPRLLEDSICTVIAQHALNVSKGICVLMEDTYVPEWAIKPFNLEPGEMFEVNWGFLMTKLRSLINFSELREEPS